jgi:hypothetical protein
MVEKKEIPLWKRILIRLLGKYPAFVTDPYGYGNLEYYYGFCREHGYYVDYPHGYTGEIRCPACEKERFQNLF